MIEVASATFNADVHAWQNGTRRFIPVLLGGFLMAATVVFDMATERFTRLWSHPSLTDRFMSFADTRFILSDADCIRMGLGIDGGVVCDEIGFPYNYPHVWLHAARVLGLEQQDTVAVALVVDLVGALAILFWIYRAQRHLTYRNAIYLAVLVAGSPPVQHALVLGNTDLLILGLVSLAALSAYRGRTLITGALWWTAGVLKGYPIVGLLVAGPAAISALSPQARSIRRVWYAVIAGFAVVVGLTLEEWTKGDGRTIRGAFASFGTTTFPSLARRLGFMDFTTARSISMFLFACTLLAILRHNWRRPVSAPGNLATAYRIGAGIHLVGFLVGSWQYRLIFMLPSLPLLVWLAGREGPGRRLATATLAGLAASAWFAYYQQALGSPYLAFVPGEALAWLVLVLQGSLLVRLGVPAEFRRKSAEARP